MKQKTSFIGFIPPCVDRFRVERIAGELVIHIPEALFPLFHSISDIADKFPEFSEKGMSSKQIEAHARETLELARKEYNTRLFLDFTLHPATETSAVLVSSGFQRILAGYRASLVRTVQHIAGSHWRSCLTPK